MHPKTHELWFDTSLKDSFLKIQEPDYFLELLLTNYERAHGAGMNPFGLSEAAMKGAELIADRMVWPLSQVIEDAIAARLRDFNLAKGRGGGVDGKR